jgi:2-polyprenyl-3-methyl-5-hydroxy-6-metoxy-1,4-benzoquinol methylase
MTVRTDPEGSEKVSLLDLVDFTDADVLEIGCGDGRLTWRYAERAAQVTAIDAFEDAISRAERALPAKLRETVHFHNVAFEDFAAATESNAFDFTILSWSLC